jgi:alpha-tubulin suppressor-like RCC1 family protein
MGITAVSAGFAHSLALTNVGGVKAWGNNGLGQLGDGTSTNSSTPVDVSGLTSGVVSISAGLAHSLALKSNCTGWAWGRNHYGQLGDGTITDRSTPVEVTGLMGISVGVAESGNSLP